MPPPPPTPLFPSSSLQSPAALRLPPPFPSGPRAVASERKLTLNAAAALPVVTSTLSHPDRPTPHPFPSLHILLCKVCYCCQITRVFRFLSFRAN
uniref:Uncharacterized protein n=1 Tax=Rhizophora mucronata TaxID=61149 RepID=A0A2P2KG44_RHIMU